ncbi:MAG: hypothetical protein M1113_02835, partial [Candidatus Thermoplasmatota archaeon]|nr:hypothetical protein [Candidatus Thermoplasmatota archaeon]
RCLFVKPEKKEYEPMGGDIERETAIEGIISQIKPLYQIERAVASQEWWDRYNQYVKPIVERGNDEIDKLLSAENVDIEEKAEKKYPEMVIKLSMIHCASRDGWKEENGMKHLIMEVQDIENAIYDLRIYKENFIQAYNSYEFKKREKARIEKILDEERKKVVTMIEDAPPEERFEYREEDVTPITNRGWDEERIRLIAYRSNKGRYISKSYIYKKTRWNKKTVDDVLTAMENAEEIETIEAESEGTKRETILIRACKIR